MGNPNTAPQRQNPFRDLNFRWLFGGSVISMLGEQFSMLALPWLVLQLTHDTMALGLVMAIMGLPRALLLFAGGAVVDRYSARRVLLVTKLVNAALLASLSYLVLTGTARLWVVDLIALALGMAQAFGMPAGTAILPQVVDETLLQGANGIIMGLRQFISLIGPALAGALIAGSATGVTLPATGTDTAGLSYAFAIDAASFLISAGTLWQVRLLVATQRPERETIRQALAAAFTLFWKDRSLRMLFLYFTAMACFVGGPIQVALPVLAGTQLPGGVASLGLLLAGHGAGALFGMLVAGARPGWRLRTLGATMLMIDACAGIVFLPLGQVHSTLHGIALLAPLGAMGGYVQVAVFTWMQKRIPAAMMGRFMSMFMFVFLGLAPLSSALAGAMLRLMSVPTLFAICGGAMLAIVLCGLLLTSIASLDDAKPAEQR